MRWRALSSGCFASGSGMRARDWYKQEAHAFFRPHPQPLAHAVGEGSHALTCLLKRPLQRGRKLRFRTP